MASSASEFQAIIKNIDSEISRLQTLIVGEDDKMIRYKVGYGTNILEQNNVLLTVFKKPSISATSFKISIDWIRALMTRFVFVPIPDHVMLLCQFHMNRNVISFGK